jgi:hypothetical protein
MESGIQDRVSPHYTGTGIEFCRLLARFNRQIGYTGAGEGANLARENYYRLARRDFAGNGVNSGLSKQGSGQQRVDLGCLGYVIQQHLLL